MKESFQLGRYAVATRDLKAGDVIFKDEAVVVGPKQITEPVCLGCYKRVDGSFRLDDSPLFLIYNLSM